MRLNDVLTIIGLSLLITAINVPNTYSILSSECPGKDVPTIRRLADQTELSFILYYVSWCHESRVAKEVYDEVAQQYYDQANFAAVNCWHLECNCSYTFPSALGSKKGYPHKWPTLLVHYGRRFLLQYHDEWKFTALSRFLENLYKPVERLNTKEELKMLSMRSNAVVLGLFPNASIIDYRKFTFAAVKWLENDPEKLVRFAVGISSVAEDIVRSLGATMPLIVLLTDKDIKVFNSSTKWTSNHIILWIKAEIKSLRKHFYGFSTPQLLADHVRRGAVLGIFVNELENPNHNFYEYMTDVMKTYGFVAPKNPSLEQCGAFWDNSEQNEAKRLYAIKLKKEFDNDVNTIKSNCLAKTLMNNAYTSYNELRMHYCKSYLMQFQPSVQQQAEDPFASLNLLQLYKYNECLRIPSNEGTPELQTVIAKLISKFIKKIANDSNTNRSNRTISVHIMDAIKYNGLLQEMGLANFEQEPSTTAFIIEPSQEGIYVMQKPFRYEKLLKFIKDYYNDSLQLMRRSRIEMPIYTSNLHVSDLNRQQFLSKIHHHWHNTTTVLLLYSPRCAISWLMSFTLMQVSTILQNSQQHHNINIVRINTHKNDLPWEFVMNEVPALLVLPSGHPEESRIFPSNMKINVRNIFGFILAQLGPLEQVHIALGSCTLPTGKLFKCLNFVKTLAMQQIQEHLRLWQLYEKDRETILMRLKLFKDITLNIQASFNL